MTTAGTHENGNFQFINFMEATKDHYVLLAVLYESYQIF